MDCYPSITKELLLNSINNSRNFIAITDEQLEIIFNCIKPTFQYKNSTWIKSTTGNFDVPRGAYDCVWPGGDIYILDNLSRIIDPKQIGLYRCDVLIFTPESNDPRIQKKISKAFKLLGF